MRISEVMIKNILERSDTLLEDISRRESELLGQIKNGIPERMATMDAAWPDRSELRRTEAESESLMRDNSLLLLHKQKKLDEYRKELNEALSDIQRQKRTVQRVLICTGCLETDARQLVLRLYRDGAKWDEVTHELGISRKTLSAQSRQAIFAIRQLYESELSDEMLRNRAVTHLQGGQREENRKNRTSEKGEIPGQISFWDKEEKP